MKTIRKAKGQLKTDPRFQIHGHDFVRFLAWYVGQHKGFKPIRGDIIERGLFASAESSEHANENLFQALMKRLRRGK